MSLLWFFHYVKVEEGIVGGRFESGRHQSSVRGPRVFTLVGFPPRVPVLPFGASLSPVRHPLFSVKKTSLILSMGPPFVLKVNERNLVGTLHFKSIKESTVVRLLGQTFIVPEI